MWGSASGVPKGVAGLLTANGNGALSLTYDENYCRAPNSVTGAAGAYSVSSNGRASIKIGGYNLVAFPVDLNRIFLFVSAAHVFFWFWHPPAPGPLLNIPPNAPFSPLSTHPLS